MLVLSKWLSVSYIDSDIARGILGREQIVKEYG